VYFPKSPTYTHKSPKYYPKSPTYTPNTSQHTLRTPHIQTMRWRALKSPTGRFHSIIPEIGIFFSGNKVWHFLLPFLLVYQACHRVPDFVRFQSIHFNLPVPERQNMCISERCAYLSNARKMCISERCAYPKDVHIRKMCISERCAYPKDVHIFQFQLAGSRKIRTSFGLLQVEIGKTESWRNTYRGVDLNATRFVPVGFSCTNSPPSCTWRKVMDGYNRNIFTLPRHHIRICRAFCNLGATHCLKHGVRAIVFYSTCSCDPLFFTTPMILSKPEWLNGNKGREFNLGFRNSLFWFPGNIKWKRPKCTDFDSRFSILIIEMFVTTIISFLSFRPKPESLTEQSQNACASRTDMH